MPRYFKDVNGGDDEIEFDSDLTLEYLGEDEDEVKDSVEDGNICDGDYVVEVEIKRRFRIKEKGVELEEVDN